ncbi:TetR family transcriptional regulator [Corynebacterium mastitidis]|uniref:TetR/AcrR family transcriptional regulator n=1 Tax=Corynebacterium mastitidis TaxID=161890 RepID=UPI0012FF4240|nr:TetR family transcriptional regulator [Corynebacterium mastitidis]MCH6196753.1 TetR family transcriptional regulator [Corynebacterium mastitidis]
MNLHRTAIVTASLEIVDSYGLGDLSMRRLARQLEVTPGALYWHVESKQRLIEMLARRILAPAVEPEGPPSSGLDPAAALRYARLVRSCLLDHRDGAEIVIAGLSMPELHREVLAACRRAAGLAREDAATFLAFILGTATLEQARRQLHNLAGAPASPPPDPEPEGESTRRFERGVRAVLAGIEATARTAAEA